MTKQEVLSLGVPEDKYSDFQAAYYRDLNKLADKKRKEDDAEASTRSAVFAMLKLVKKRQSLEKILCYVHRVYCEEV
mgnify:CR=1 FL=1